MVTQVVYCSGNKEIDNFIQENQLKRNSHYDIMFEWIPYNQFGNIEEISKGDVATIYSAIWKNGPFYNWYRNERDSNKEVALKYLHNNSQNSIEFLINEVQNFYKYLKHFLININLFHL